MTNFLRIGSLFALVLATIVTLCAAVPALAVEPIKIARDDIALDLSGAVEIYRNQGENFQVSTAPGPDGIVRRIEVEANDARSTGDWAVFALANTTDQQLDRLIVAPHFRLVNSGIFWPDLGSTGIPGITPSEGSAPATQRCAQTGAHEGGDRPSRSGPRFPSAGLLRLQQQRVPAGAHRHGFHERRVRRVAESLLHEQAHAVEAERRQFQGLVRRLVPGSQGPDGVRLRSALPGGEQIAHVRPSDAYITGKNGEHEEDPSSRALRHREREGL